MGKNPLYRFNTERKSLSDIFDRPEDAMRGHPTAPGPPDDSGGPRRGRASPGNGVPGIPKMLTSKTNRGPGIPGTSPTGPMQPGAGYDNPDDQI